MRTWKLGIILFASTGLMAACGGGGGSGGERVMSYTPPAELVQGGDGATVTLPDGTTKTYSHWELVNAFVKVLQGENDRKGDPDFMFVKGSTYQKNFFVFKDFKTITESSEIRNPLCESAFDNCQYWIPGPDIQVEVSIYYAMDITGWTPGMNAMDFIKNNSSIEKVTHEGNDNYGAVFIGQTSGLKFEKSATSPKNLARMKAFQETYKIEANAERMTKRYGLSVEKAVQASKFAYRISTAAPGTYQMSDYDAFTKEFVGSTISEFETDVRSGDLQAIQKRLEIASELTGASLEGVNAFINDVFR